jgi:hypothetical protein
LYFLFDKFIKQLQLNLTFSFEIKQNMKSKDNSMWLGESYKILKKIRSWLANNKGGKINLEDKIIKLNY